MKNSHADRRIHERLDEEIWKCGTPRICKSRNLETWDPATIQKQKSAKINYGLPKMLARSGLVGRQKVSRPHVILFRQIIPWTEQIRKCSSFVFCKFPMVGCCCYPPLVWLLVLAEGQLLATSPLQGWSRSPRMAAGGQRLNGWSRTASQGLPDA